MPFQKIMHVLEEAAKVDRREAAFPEKKGKPWQKSMYCNFWFLPLLFLLGCFVCLFACFCCMEDVTTVVSSLYSVQEPSTDGSEWVHGIVIPSTCARRWKSWLLTSPWAAHLLQALPPSGKHDSVASNVRDESDGNGGFTCGTSEKWGYSCVALWKQRTTFNRRNRTDWQVRADAWVEENTNTTNIWKEKCV